MRRPPARAVVAVVLVATVSCGTTGGVSKDRSPTSSAEAATTTTRRVERPVDATPGAADVADPVAPGAGNGGYDVEHYDLAFDVREPELRATTTITSKATQDLSAFNLDLHGFDVGEVAVAGHGHAAFARAGDELTVTPEDPIAEGDEFVTTVTYSGEPQPVDDPSAPGRIGWLSAPSGTFTAAEPVGAKGIFPGNDHPSDKATFTIEVTAPATSTVVANGVLDGVGDGPGGSRRSTFRQTDPMATYLVQIAVGDYDVVPSTGPHGLPLRDVVVRSVPAQDRGALGDTAAQIAYFESLFGTFPLDTYGVLVADAPPDFALETQTLTLMPASWMSGQFGETSAVLAHELSHQWFGDAVTPADWGDIWLNEGFATYAEWLWDDHTGARALDQNVEEAMSQAQRWRDVFGPVLDPKPEYLFSPNEYGGAGLVLHALRLTVGDDAFFRILRTWVSDRGGTSVTTEDFQELANEVAGRDLTPLFDAWLRSTTLPSLPR